MSGQDSSNRLGTFYPVILGVAALIIVLFAALTYRNKRRRISQRRGADRQSTSSQPPSQQTPAGGASARAAQRYWPGRRRGIETRMEEGLNEEGEAPPPYLAKRASQEVQGPGGDHEGEPPVPLQTLSREEIGLKPPGYLEALRSDEGDLGTRSGTSLAGSARPHEPNPDGAQEPERT